MSEKDRYIALCNTEESIPLFGRPWWLDVVCGASKWDVLLVEDGNNILAAMPLYKPLSNVISMPCYTQTMGPRPPAIRTYWKVLITRRYCGII